MMSSEQKALNEIHYPTLLLRLNDSQELTVTFNTTIKSIFVSLLSDIAQIWAESQFSVCTIQYPGSQRYTLSWVVIEIGFDELLLTNDV